METGQFTENDLKRFLNYTKSQLYSSCSGDDPFNPPAKAFEWFNNPSHRIIKLLSYSLIRTVEGRGDISSILSGIQTDLASKDDDQQLDAMKLMCQLPHESAILVFRSSSKIFIENLKIPSFHCERLSILHDFLFKMYLKRFSSEEDYGEDIVSLYLNIIDLIFQPNRDIASNSLSVIFDIFSCYCSSESTVNTVQLWFGGLGSVKSNLKVLVMKLLNFIIPRFQDLLNKILSYEWRLRCEFLYGFVSIMEACIGLSEELYGSTTMGISVNLTNFSANKLIVELSNESSETTRISSVNAPQNDCFSMDSLRHSFQIILEQHVLQDTTLKGFQESETVVFQLKLAIRMIEIAQRYTGIFLFQQHKRIQLIQQIWNQILVNFAKKDHNTNDSLVYCYLNIGNICLQSGSISNSLQIAAAAISYSMSCAHPTEYQRGLLCVMSANCIIKAYKNIINSSTKDDFLSNFVNAVIKNNSIPKEDQAQSANSFFGALAVVALNSLDKSTSFIVFQQILDLIYIHLSNSSITVPSYSKDIQSQQPQQQQQQQQSIKLNTQQAALIEYSSFQAIDAWILIFNEIFSAMSPTETKQRIIQLDKLTHLSSVGFASQLKSTITILELQKNNQLNAQLKQQFNFFESLFLIKSFLIQPKLPGFFLENTITQQIYKEYLALIIKIFECLLEISRLSSGQYKQQVINLNNDYYSHLLKIQKIKGICLDFVQEQIDLTKKLQENIRNEDSDVEFRQIEEKEESLGSNNSNSKNNKDDAYPLFAAFEVLQRNNRKIGREQEIEENTLINVTQGGQPLTENNFNFGVISSSNGYMKSLNCFENPMKLISGISDCLQVYAAAATYPPQQLISIHLQIFNLTSLKIDEISVSMLHPQGMRLFPNESKSYMIEEINPMHSREINFCLKIAELESANNPLDISFTISFSQITLQTLPYSIGLEQLITSHSIIQASSYLFKQLWEKQQFQEHSYKINNLKIKLPFKIFCKENRRLFTQSSVILSDGLQDKYKTQRLLFTEINNQDKNTTISQEQLENQAFMEVYNLNTFRLGMLFQTWFGQYIGMVLTTLKKQNHQTLEIEFRAEDKLILEILKIQADKFIERLFQGSVAFV